MDDHCTSTPHVPFQTDDELGRDELGTTTFLHVLHQYLQMCICVNKINKQRTHLKQELQNTNYEFTKIYEKQKKLRIRKNRKIGNRKNRK